MRSRRLPNLTLPTLLGGPQRRPVSLFKSLSSSTANLSRLNYSHIILIPKKVEHPMIKDYRSIYLEHCIIKFISKVLSNRLGKVIDSLITPSHITFIKGREIFKSYVRASEIINYFYNSKTLGILVKIDFEKAFDSILWDFLFTLRKKRLRIDLHLMVVQFNEDFHLCNVHQRVTREMVLH